MKYVPLFVLRLLLSILAAGSVWQLMNGEVIRPLHPVNLLIFVSLFVGAVFIWIPGMHKIACVGAITFVVVFAFQISMLIAAFPAGATFTSNWGPLRFEGVMAHIALWLPMAMIAISAILVFRSTPKRA